MFLCENQIMETLDKHITNSVAKVSRVLIKCRQPAKKPVTWRFEPSTFAGNRVNRESEGLKLPTALTVIKPPTFTS